MREKQKQNDECNGINFDIGLQLVLNHENLHNPFSSGANPNPNPNPNPYLNLYLKPKPNLNLDPKPWGLTSEKANAKSL